MCSDEKEQVRSLLRDAFPLGPEKRPLSHEEAVRCRNSLSLFYPHELPFFLGQVLEDLLDYHSGESALYESSSMVIMLNVLSYSEDDYSSKDYGWMYGAVALAKREFDDCSLRLGGIGTFAGFSEKQAYAVLRWLELAGKWEDVEGYEGDLRAAISYWRRRAGNLVG